MNFPHMQGSTDFPHLDNMNIYKYSNNFDYTRWQPTTKIKLCNVLFNSSYENVVKFNSNEERDKYFDSISGYSETLTSDFHIMPDNTIKLPIPFDIMAKYNYCYVDLPIVTSSDNMIDYENDRGNRRYYYFISNISQAAPSTIVCNIYLDVWTTFINDIDISYMYVERTGAALLKNTVKDYLSNPIDNCEYLLADDYKTEANTRIKNSTFIPFGNGTKYICIATTMNILQIEQIIGSIDSTVTSPSYYNTNDRWGYQYGVNGYEFSYGNKDYSKASTVEPDTFQSSDNIVPNNVTMFAFNASKANTFFDNLNNKAPFFLKSVTGMIVLSEDLFTKSNSFTFMNVTCYEVHNNGLISENISLNKSMFNYDPKYAELTKLYTSPYATLEITDNEGKTFNIDIENCGKLSISKQVSISFPFLRINAFVNGVGGNGTNDYVWKNINNDDINKQIGIDDFSKYMGDYDIPIYSIYQSGQIENQFSNYFEYQAQRQNALLAYQNGTRSSNTNYENDTAANNMINTNAHNLNNTANTNAHNSNNAENTNATNLANTAKANANESANTENTNANNTANTGKANSNLNVAASIADTSFATGSATTNTNRSNSYQQALQAWDSGLQTAVMEADSQAAATTTMSNSLGNIANGLLTGGVSGVVGAAIDSVCNGVNAVVAINCNQTKVNATISNSQSKLGEMRTFTSDTTSTNNSSVTNQTDTNANANRNIASNTQTTMITNASNTRNTSVNNATRTNSTSISNASRTQATGNENADNTLATGNENADNTKNIGNSNALYSRDSIILNNKNALENAQRITENTYKNNKFLTPVKYGSNSGDVFPDIWQRRGLQIKIRTENNGDIAQIGDAFLRYGYAINRNFTITDLQPLNYFCYWKSLDVWITSSNTYDFPINSISDIFKNGTTVWDNPEKIGKVSIYDNFSG